MTRLALMLCALVLSFAAPAQTYPTKPLRLVVGFPPGGGTDAVARLIGPKLSETFGQPVVIDNRPGADTVIATEYAARATPDGYTLLLTTGAIAINMSLYGKVAYDAARDFAPIALIAASPHVLVVGPALQVKTLTELVDTARARSGQLNYSAAGGPQHLAAELFKLRSKTNITYVPYKGGGPALTALLGGEVHMSFSNIPTTIAHVKAGRLRLLGVTSPARTPLLPDAPTIKEQGIDVQTAVWYGLLAPAATPKPVLARVEEATIKIARAEDVRQRLVSMGTDPLGSGVEVFGPQLRAEVKQWAEIVRLTGAKPD